jgi:hypothetical protein
MEEEILLDENTARIVDILSQIQALNAQIDLHKAQTQDSFMIQQYEYMRNLFITELENLLGNFRLSAHIRQIAA